MTTKDIKNKEFDAVKRGYDPDQVKSYLGQVADQLQSLETEKASLIKKLEVLARKVEEYKKDEESIQGALLGAQKLAKSTIMEAKEKADALSTEARTKAEELVMRTKAESEQISTEAKNFSQELVSKARAEAEKMVSEAKTNVENTLRTSRYEIEKEQTNLLRTQKEVSRFKKELLDIYRTHIDLIQKLPEDEAGDNDEKEVRELQKDIYKQKSEAEVPAEETAEKTSETPVTEEAVTEVEEPAAVSAEGDAPAETTAEEKTEKPFVSKFGELKFGGNTQD